MKPDRSQIPVVTFLGVVALAYGSAARADVGPPMKISMPADSLSAKSGVEYRGAFTVDVREAGTLSGFEIHGEGWTILEVDVSSDSVWAEQGVLRIPFRAIPTDANQPLSLTLRYEGRRVTRSLRIGSAAFARRGQRGKDHVSVRVESVAQKTLPPSPLTPEMLERVNDVHAARGDLTLRFQGRIVYNRPTAVDGLCMNPPTFSQEGVDFIWVEVMDQDDDWDDTIWSGRTNPDGTFDTGWFTWDDWGDTPDIYLRYECDTGIVNVQDGEDILESEWSWSNIDDYISDWEGSFYDFGTHTPGDSAQMPALHIHNSITRGHRFLTSRGIATLPEVDVLWPSGDNASYSDYYQEIKVSTRRQWHDGTHLHEYGHHFMHHEAGTVDPDYCNDWCDGETTCTSGTDCENPGHCAGCPETDHDALGEGFPNWMADLILRSWATDYTLSDGSDWVTLGPCDRNQESLTTCCQDGLMHDGTDALITERFVGALFRDMEDATQDDHDTDGIMDSLCLGFDEIFQIIMLPSQPLSVEDFITHFRALYPEHEEDFWRTAYNVSPAYTDAALYAPDTLDPAAVTWADSPTHPLGVGGVMPCVTIEWLPPDDDVTGACAYSYDWNTDSANTFVDLTADTDVDLTECLPRVTAEFFDLGEYYFHVRAQDCALTGRHWGPSAVFGPFVIGDCNNNGILDVCEIACDASGANATPPCTTNIPPWICAGITGCGTAPDCNVNLVPDDCDIASGTSEDCNLNAVPDECENMFHWTGTSGSWHSDINWLEGEPPTSDSSVCIHESGDQTVTYSDGSLQIASLACSENLSIASDSYPWADLTLHEASWVDGNMELSVDNTVLRVDDRLDIGGLFEWNGSNISYAAKLVGLGVTYANGGVKLVDVVRLDGHLVLDGHSTSITTTGQVYFLGGSSVLEISPGSIYEHQGRGYALHGWTGDMFDNDGTFIASVDTGAHWINVFTDNSGLIHAQNGTLALRRGSSSTGAFLGDPGTMLEFSNGGHEFLPNSSIVADNVTFNGGNTVHGTYDVTTATTHTEHSLTFTSEANIISYGSAFYISSGTVNFDAIVGGNITFDTLSVGGTGYGTANFNSGDPVQVTNLVIGPGTIQGPSTVSVSTHLTWGGSSGSASFKGPGVVNVDGDMTIAASSTNYLQNRVLNNAGHTTFLGRLSLASSAVFNNLASGVIDIQNDGDVFPLDASSSFNNAGMLVKSAGVGTSTIAVDFSNSGIVEVQSGVLEFRGYTLAQQTQTAGRTVLNGGDLAFTNGAPYDIQGGQLTGAGTITGNVVNAGGRVEPGLSIGRLVIDGTYTQRSASSLGIELDGSLHGEYDTLVCTGNVSLAGDLEVTLSQSFAPNHGDFFQIVQGGPVTGEFEHVGVTNLPPQMEVVVYYAPTTVTLIVPPVDGDCDEDYVVGMGDHSAFVSCLAGPQCVLGPDCDCADIDSDGDVDLGDLALLQVSFTGPLP